MRLARPGGVYSASSGVRSECSSPFSLPSSSSSEMRSLFVFAFRSSASNSPMRRVISAIDSGAGGDLFIDRLVLAIHRIEEQYSDDRRAQKLTLGTT